MDHLVVARIDHTFSCGKTVEMTLTICIVARARQINQPFAILSGV